MRTTAFFAFMALLSAGCGGTAQKSPSGNIRAEVFAGKEGLYYTVTHDGRTVIDTSALGITIDDTELFRDAALRPAGTRKIDETYSVTGRKAVSEGRCNEYLFDVTHRPSGYKYRLQTRLYDDGFAYRFVLPGDGTRTVNGEAAQWRPPHQSRVWFAERNSGWKLLTYAGEWISTTADSLHIVSRQGPVQTMPLLYRPPDEYVMIAEAALYDYSGMRLRAEPGASLRADFTEQEGFELSGDIVTPWRVTIIARDLDALVNTDIITSLNPAPDPELFADTSWIVPGRSLWSWWSGIDGGFMTLEGEKRVIDTAASLGIEYSTVDDGGKSVPTNGNSCTSWPDTPNPRRGAVRMAPLGETQRSGGRLPPDARLSGLGRGDRHKGVKVDFMNGEGIRQIDFNTHLLKNAARRRLMVNLHGCQKPTGEIRTYPNEITREGVRGIELNRITANYEKRMRDESRTPDPDRYVPGDENQNIPASHNAALPFTRGVLGAADYTPVAFTMPGGTTAAHQLAFALLLDSPLLTIAENPFVLSGDERYRPALDIIRRLPTVWDETVVLPQSEIGRLAVIARRKGGTWYIAGVNTAPAEVTIPAGLIPATARKAQIARDAADGSLQTTEVALPAPEPLSVQLPENGGFIAVLE
ncbi:MAG: glycoside hydrolase family 97 N-terminal domain-containing protein [Alistipes finegoldii]